MDDEGSSSRVWTQDCFTAVKKHGVPEQNIPFSGEESLLFEPTRLSGNPVVITLRDGRRAGMQVRLGVIIELGKPFRPVGSRTVNERAAIGSDVFTRNPAPKQKTARMYVKHRHVLMQPLAASASERDA